MPDAMAFIFYDTETTGTDPAFDQILQVAAILTDDDLIEIDSFDLRCRLLPHIVPSLTAMLITGMTIEGIEAAPLSHTAMMVELRRRLLTWSRDGAVFAGWNSLSFDEEMLRQGFYQSLLPVYLTNTRGNRRADIMRMAQTIRAVRPDAIAAGMGPGGKVTYRLGLLAEANGIDLDNAHDALADARATLEIARLLKARAPDLWDRLIVNAARPAAQKLIAENDLLVLADHRFGNLTATIVTPLGTAGTQAILFDLGIEPQTFLAADDVELKKLLASSPRPVRRAPLNKQPGLFPIDYAPDELPGGRLPVEVYAGRARLLRDHPDIAIRITALMTGAFDDAPEPPYVEQRMYRGFPTDDDERLMTAFHIAPWEDRRWIVGQIPDPRLRTLGLRMIAAERPDLLGEEERTRYDAFLTSRWTTTEKVPWHTVPDVLQEVAALPPEMSALHAQTIASLTHWLQFHRAGWLV